MYIWLIKKNCTVQNKFSISQNKLYSSEHEICYRSKIIVQFKTQILSTNINCSAQDMYFFDWSNIIVQFITHFPWANINCTVQDMYFFDWTKIIVKFKTHFLKKFAQFRTCFPSTKMSYRVQDIFFWIDKNLLCSSEYIFYQPMLTVEFRTVFDW